jgi:hypothetical protein
MDVQATFTACEDFKPGYLYNYSDRIPGAGVAQLVSCLTMDWTAGRSGFNPRQGQRTFPLVSVTRPALEPTQPIVEWVCGVLSPGLMRGRGRDADHSPPSSAEVENE